MPGKGRLETLGALVGKWSGKLESIDETKWRMFVKDMIATDVRHVFKCMRAGLVKLSLSVTTRSSYCTSPFVHHRNLQ